MRSVFISLTMALLLLAPALGRADEEPDFSPLTSTTNQVEGLTLPADMEVPADAGLIKIKAKASGPVRFQVLGSVPGVKAEASGKTVVISIPPVKDAQIVVFACTVLITKGADGKIASAQPSELARCVITVVGPDNPQPKPEPPAPPQPAPKPQPKLVGKGYAVLIYDPQANTAEIAAVLNSQKLRQQPQLAVRVVDHNDPFLKQKRLADKVQSTPWVIIQNGKGEIVASQALPATDDALIALISSLRGS